MNHIYKTIFNKKTGKINIVSGNCSNQGKNQNSTEKKFYKKTQKNKSLFPKLVKKSSLATAIGFSLTMTFSLNSLATPIEISDGEFKRGQLGDGGQGGNGSPGDPGSPGDTGDNGSGSGSGSGGDGGNGAQGSHGSIGVQGSNGGHGGIGGRGGDGSSAISDDGTEEDNLLNITNNGYILGRDGGQGGNAGKGGNGGNGGRGGNGGIGGLGGIGINGDYLDITNIRKISGGKGGNGGQGGQGGQGGDGGQDGVGNDGGQSGQGGQGGAGNLGASGINGNGLVITNSSSYSEILGGNGGSGGQGGAGNDGSIGGLPNIDLPDTTLSNGSDGSNGGNGGNGGLGASGINGNKSEITNNGRISGGDGGQGGNGGRGGNGGYGGGGGGGNDGFYNYGQNGGNGGSGGDGGDGGDGINGNTLEITNNGLISGGKGGKGGSGGDRGQPDNSNASKLGEPGEPGDVGKGGNGGDAIQGSDLTITNHGAITRGEGVEEGAAIRTMGGENSLTLENGSSVTGDIILESAATNTLDIISNVETAIDGNLIANNNTHVIISGKTTIFNKDATFRSNTSLTFNNDCDGCVVGKTLIVNNWIKEGDGHITFNTVFGGDNSLTDKLIINDHASGTTEVRFKNVGGAGAQTVNGIKVIETGSSDDDAFFIGNGGYVSAGAYDYGLFLDQNNWYLKSHLSDKTPVYTPDVGEYLAAETMGNTLFTSRLEDREGASQYQNLGNNKDVGNVWVRAYGNHNQFKTMQGQLKTTGNSFVTQIGTGLVTLGEEDQYNLGAMTGFATYDGKTRSNLTDRESKTKINGYSLGLYGTWYAHPVEKRGAYIDSWVLWNKFNNKIDTPDQNQYKYDSSGITASIEAGGDYLISKNGKKDWWIQPQAQLIYQGVHADNFKDAQGVDINHGRDNLQARMGVKTYLNIATNGNALTSYRPYVALNFIHNTNPYSVVINDIRYENEGSANLGELKFGVEGNVTKNSQVWLNASYIAGSHDNQAYQGNIGWKYNF